MMALGQYPAFTVDQAREAARRVLHQARAGIDPQQAARALIDAPTVAMLADLYLNEYAEAQALRSATVRNARALLANVLPKAGKWKVAAVTVADIRKLHGDTRASGVEQGSKGVYQANRLLAVLSKMFSLAIERGWRSDNPCKGVRKFPEDQRWRNLNDGEVGRLLRACDTYEADRRGDEAASEAANAVRLLLFSGARLQEVLRAEWSQFDLVSGLWVKPSSHTKTKRQHRLELDGPALELLRTMKGNARHVRFMFPGNAALCRKTPIDIRSGEPLGIKPRADLRHPWKVIRALARLDDVRLHDLRRTTASFMLSGGASLATVGKALGHTQASTTARYAQLAASVQREGLRVAGERMSALRGMQISGRFSG
jgi:integrase